MSDLGQHCLPMSHKKDARLLGELTLSYSKFCDIMHERDELVLQSTLRNACIVVCKACIGMALTTLGMSDDGENKVLNVKNKTTNKTFVTLRER